jgi:hypothetical protein
MPRAYDQKQLVVDRNPLQQLPVDYGKLPKLDPIDPADLLNTYLTSITRITGIDLTGVGNFLESIKDAVGLLLTGFGAAWNGLINGISDVWNGITGSIDKAWTDAVVAIQGIFGTATNAKLSAANANIGVQALKAQLAGGGADEFDYENANVLPSALYEISASGPGAGNYGPSGTGYLVWKPSGSLLREIIYRRTDVTLAGDNQIVTAVWAEKPFDTLLFKTYGYICGRMSLVSSNTHVRARISDNDARIEVVVSGTVTALGASISLDVNDGDVFELWLGHPDHPRRFRLVQNGVTVLTRDDGTAAGVGAVSERGSGYRQPGFGARVDTYLLLFQNRAPSLAGWTWALQPEGGS